MMRILHTADWHLGDRMGRIDRTEDLRRAVERVASYCAEEKADVLLVAGDLFSELSRPDSLRESIEHLQGTFEKFLLDGGTILAITGNHDNENFCQTLRLVMNLAAPAAGGAGDVRPCGRLYLAANPTFLRLADRDGRRATCATPRPSATAAWRRRTATCRPPTPRRSATSSSTRASTRPSRPSCRPTSTSRVPGCRACSASASRRASSSPRTTCRRAWP